MHLLISWSIVVVIFGNLNYWLLAYRLLTCGDEKLLNFVKLDNKEPCMALNKEAPKTPATPKI